MGKNKLNQTFSTEISKHDKNKQMNSLIKVLRPKVYITDSLSFKRLVQELTGNGNSSVSSPPSPPDHYPISSPESSMIPAIPQGALEGSVDAGFSFNSQETFRQETDITPELVSQIHVGEGLSSLDHDSTMVSYEDIEAWLLDVNNPCSFYDDHHTSLEQQICIFDYELPGLL